MAVPLYLTEGDFLGSSLTYPCAAAAFVCDPIWCPGHHHQRGAERRALAAALLGEGGRSEARGGVGPRSRRARGGVAGVLQRSAEARARSHGHRRPPPCPVGPVVARESGPRVA